MKSPNNRRRFLKCAALMPLAVTLGNTHAQEVTAATRPSPRRRPGAKIKLSLNAWSYYVPIETLPTLGKEGEYDAYTRVPELLNELRKAIG